MCFGTVLLWNNPRLIEIDKGQYREFVMWLVDLYYRTRHELVAHQVAVGFLAAAGQGQGFEQLLEQARKNPSPALLADQQAARDEITRLLTEEKCDAALEFLKKWKPGGAIH